MVRFLWPFREDCPVYAWPKGRSWPLFILAAIATLDIGPSALATAPSRVITLVDRTVTQDQGAWIINYRLRHTGATGIVITPEEIAVKVDGWVSNSRISNHAIARWSSLSVMHTPELSALGDVISSTDEAQKCRERLLVSAWRDIDVGARKLNGLRQSGSASPLSPTPSVDALTTPPFSLAPGTIVRVRVRLEHQHILYGELDPLLAVRTVELSLGAHTIRDVVPLDREHYLAYPKSTWPEPPVERRDTRHSVSGPDSLHLEAHIPGHPYYRYPARPVRYGTRMRLRFWYLIAVGTEGECGARVTQYRDTPDSWLKLDAASFDLTLKTIGRWTEVERIIQTDSQATSLALEFKIIGEIDDVGDMWIDDVSLELVNNTSPAGP